MLSVSEIWDRAQQLEATRSWKEARALYEQILATDPMHVAARLRMSRMEQLADGYLESKQHAIHAAEAVRSESRTRLIGYVTARLLDFAEEGEAASLILDSDWADPHVLRQAPTLAQHLWLAGRYEDALRFLSAVGEKVAHPLLTFTYANVLRYLGDMSGAEQAYEACLSQSPDLADAHWALATHSNSRPALSRVARLHDSLSRVRSGSLDQAQLLYALFREFDAADVPDKAWSALRQGAAVMRKALTFDPQTELAQAQMLMRVPLSRPSSIDSSVVPVFIIGMPRTGTTLLDRILGNHASVESLGERNDFSAAVSEASGRFFRGALQVGSERVLSEVPSETVGRLYLQRLANLARGTPLVIDKNPQNLFNLPFILSALPSARILCLRREPMDACFSNLKELFQGGAYAYSYGFEDLVARCRLARRWMKHWEAVAPESVRVVDYEALVGDPDATCASVLGFLGLESQNGLTDITRNRAPVSTASSAQVREDVHQRAVGAWRRYESYLQPLRELLSAE